MDRPWSSRHAWHLGNRVWGDPREFVLFVLEWAMRRAQCAPPRCRARRRSMLPALRLSQDGVTERSQGC